MQGAISSKEKSYFLKSSRGFPGAFPLGLAAGEPQAASFPALDALGTAGPGLRLAVQLGPCGASAAWGPSKLGTFGFLRKGVDPRLLPKSKVNQAFCILFRDSGFRWQKILFPLKRVVHRSQILDVPDPR